ncbi:MAG: ABC transporter ATP-binding protein [Cryomorphaceae bacterium]|nr:ABC transporter ATP-binding protein [Cryomorphaceae bacterium]
MSELLRFNGVDIGNGKTIVNQLNLCLHEGERLGLVGESGSGKTLSALSIAGLLPGNLRISSGQITIHLPDSSIHFPNASTAEIKKLRRQALGFVFQEPMSALNPVKSCGWQLAENIQLTRNLSNKSLKAEVLHWMKEVELPNPERIYHAFPHQLSGGQRQRLMIAMALCNHPKLLIADEPTTALDVRVRDVVLNLIEQLCKRYKTALLLISHDLKMVAKRCDNIAVLRSGLLCEYGPASDVVNQPKHAYTKALWACRPDPENRVIPLPSVKDIENNRSIDRRVYNQEEWLSLARQIQSTAPVLSAKNLRFSYGETEVLKGVSFNLHPGEALGILGESGCGKSTLSRIISGLEDIQEGELTITNDDGLEVDLSTKTRQWRAERIQMIFQDAMAALNPSHTIGRTLADVRRHFFPMENRSDCRRNIEETLENMGLSKDAIHRYPHAFSGGQRQRICIARALLAEPKILICDESVAALDVSVQAQILNLLTHIRDEKGMSFIFISHDPDTVRYFCHRVLDMEKGVFINS